MDLIARTIGNAAGLWLAVSLLSGMTLVSGSTTTDTVLTYLVVGFVLALVNSIIKPVATFLAFPLYVLTFGLFALVVNGAMLVLASRISQATGHGLVLSSFGTAIIGSLIVSLISAVVVGVFGPQRED